MGKAAKFVVRLTIGERVNLHGVVDGKRTAQQKSRRAGLLLKADVEWPNWTDSQIGEAFEISTLTVARLRKRCVLEGLEAALCQRPQAVRKPRPLGGVGEAQLVALAQWHLF